MTSTPRYALLLSLLLGLVGAPSHATVLPPLWNEDTCTEPEMTTGELRNGKKHGHWVEEKCDESGFMVERSRQEGSYVNGQKHGHWVETTTLSANPLIGGLSLREEGPYVDGRRHGHWVRRLTFGDMGEEGPYDGEGPYVDGRKHGHWVVRAADGRVSEGSYVDDEPHGRWVERAENGAVLEVIHCGDGCPEVVVIPGGTFTMGSPDGERGRWKDEGPQHTVTIARFAVGRHEVTTDEWEACHDDGGCSHEPHETDEEPVATWSTTNISWHDAKEYVAWLSRRTGETYRLLTEAEWEYAARAGTTTAYHWGNEARVGYENCEDCDILRNDWGTVPTGSFPPNGFGLHDMEGNVWEWVEDCWHSDYTHAPSDGRAWEREDDGDCDRRVLRGGSLFNDDEPKSVRSAARNWADIGKRHISIGFRVARTLD